MSHGEGPRIHFGDIDEYVDHFARLVEMEREEEMRRHIEEMERLSGQERERVGRALLDMRGRDSGLGLGGRFLVKFVKGGAGGRSVPLPDLDMGIGDLVLISKGRPTDDDPSGTLTDMTGRSVTVAFDRRPPGFVYKRGLRVDLYVNDITFQRMLDALAALPGDREWSALLLGQWSMDQTWGDIPGDIKNRALNESQVRAVSRALASPGMYLVHGPPGTGKTVTCIEVIEQLVDSGDKVLATADSNVAVDNLLEMLLDRGRRALRVGHPARVTPVLRERTLDYMVQDHPAYKRSMEIREEAFELKEEQDQHTLPSGRWRRGLSDERILQLAERGQGSRGIPSGKIKSMARWIGKRRELDEMFARADELQQEAIDDLIAEADIVCTTNSSAGSELLARVRFDTGVIDEATQAVEPACLIPLLKTGKVVLAGDHRQLPPTILNREAEREGLAVTMFERLLEVYGEDLKTLLEVQYRMHRDIMDFPNQEFYGGRIGAHPSVEAHTLEDLGIAPPPDDAFRHIRAALDPSVPMVFLDTGEGGLEESPRGSTSRRNRTEADIVVELARSFLSTGIPARDVAVITPYDAQVGLLRSELWRDEEEPELEIGTVDGFQGREKEVIILSLVRSNRRDDLGFLTDLRRLNVSITRARRKLVVVGDAGTISSHPVYRAMVDYFRDRGTYMDLSDGI